MKLRFIIKDKQWHLCVMLIISLMSSGCREKNSMELDCVKTVVIDNYWETPPSNSNDSVYPRRILLVYKVTNTYPEPVFLPIKLSLNDTTFCSQFHVKINGMPADDVLGMTTRIKNNDRELQPGQTTFVYVNINGRNFNKYGLKQTDSLKKILSILSVEYESCKADSVNSVYPMTRLNIIKAENIEYQYRTDSTYNSLCL